MGILTLNITQCPIYEICDSNIDGVTTSSSGYSKISATALQLSTGVLGDYAIEWRLNTIDGELLFISGNIGNTDSSISVTQPFTNEIVPGGTIYPVIKYVYIDGVKYDGYYSDTANYSPDLRTCILPQDVVSMECDNGGSGTYSHSLSYSYENPNGSATRETTFLYPNDGSEAYFAFKYTAYEVVDMIKVYSVKEGPSDTITHLIGFAVGTNNNNANLITSGSLYVTGEENYYIKYNNFSFVINLTGVECDYLKIEITSSAIDTSNTATDWVLNMKCLPTWDCDAYIINTGWTTLDVDNIDLTWDSTNCYYITHTPSLEAKSINSQYNAYQTFAPPSRSFASTTDNKTYTGVIEVREEGYSGYVNLNTNCYTLDGTVTYNRDKTLEKLTISFDNYNDFNYYKSSYESVMADSNISNYSLDNTNINFFKYIYLREEFRTINCNQDNSIFRYLYFHPSAYVNFNNVPGDYYMEIFTPTNSTDPSNLILPHYPLTNGLTDSTCSTVYEEANGFVYNMNRLYNYSSFNDITNFTNISPFTGVYMFSGNTSQTYVNTYYAEQIAKFAVDEVCPTFDGSIYSLNTVNSYSTYIGDTYKLYHHALRFVLTNPTTENGGSVDDYEVYEAAINGSGNPDYSDLTLIKKVVGGVDQPL